MIRFIERVDYKKMIRFGPAGNSESFTKKGYKGNLDVPKYLKEFGLNAFEYQAGHGVRIQEKSALAFGKVLKEGNISVSLHAPYYISLSSAEKEKRDNSVNYILQSAKAVTNMGGNRIVVHSGSVGRGRTRGEALILALETVKNAQKALDENSFSKVRICLEVMGKIGQLGTLEEVMELCRVDERILPCIDFGHLNSRTNGSLKGYEDYLLVLNEIKNRLGEERLKNFHGHFSKIEYTKTGGEKRHLTFSDKKYGPEFSGLAKALLKTKSTPVIICESAGTQAEDALEMKKIYETKKGEEDGRRKN